ncbi:LPO_1073/Vpar_1526 family protein [Pedobacter suwonensis]|nr:LPO_1073/Vpar_1526 family protein [Pedobacter suwonensis]
MMLNNKNQKAGDNSNQLQAESIIVNVGIDEKRAREIYQEMNLQLRKDYSQEALTIANSRVKEFENRLLPKMEAVDGALETFADPSFQLLLVEAQKTAASTERPADYDLLAELLIHRFQKGENRVVRAGISRAVEIVDEISDEALLGLTVFHSISNFFPASGDIHKGLNVLNDLYGKIFYNSLPTGNEWLDHLDILDAIRVNSFGNLKKINQYYPEMLSGYIDVGIEKNSDNYIKAIELLKNAHLPQNILVEHSLNGNFARINVSEKNQIDSLTLQQQIVVDQNTFFVPIALTEEQKNVIKSIYKLYKKDETIKQNNIKIFMAEWDKWENLKTLREWWDNINGLIQITSVGKVLAHSNAQRCDKNLPPLT